VSLVAQSLTNYVPCTFTDINSINMIMSDNLKQQNIAVELLKFLLRIQESPRSNIGAQMDCPK
jgi:hypothetical protein